MGMELTWATRGFWEVAVKLQESFGPRLGRAHLGTCSFLSQLSRDAERAGPRTGPASWHQVRGVLRA